MIPEVDKFATELVIDDFWYRDLELRVSLKTKDRRSNRPVFIDIRPYNFRQNVAVEKKRQGHVSRAKRRTLPLKLCNELLP